MRRILQWLERISLLVEKPIDRLVGQPQLNPLYHTGTIAVFMAVIVLVTGIYLTMFYQFGFDATYQAVARLEANLVGRTMRALHRYASGALLVATLLHGWRTFFQGRFRGPRWLAWVSGVILAALVWAAGVTGYWLIWDVRAGLLNQTLVRMLQNSRQGIAFLLNYLVTARAGTGWVFLVLVITAHLGLSALIGLFFWLHVKRLTRAKLLPPRFWMLATGGLLLGAALVLPVGMLPAIDPARLAERVPVDLFFLFYLPAGLNWSPLLLWGGSLVLLALISAVPWLGSRKLPAPVAVEADRCTGCTLCAADCPYRAIRMVARPDGERHKYLAQVDPQRCVACGICIGTCQPLALSLEGRPAELLWQATLQRVSNQGNRPVRVIFTCERHAQHGAAPYLAGQTDPGEEDRTHYAVLPLPCIGMAHPDLAVQALQAGAAEVRFAGCPPEDCVNREGNVWLQARLDRERLPRLRVAHTRSPIFTAWRSPVDFSQALRDAGRPTATAYPGQVSLRSWRSVLPALALLAVVLVWQLWLSDRPIPAYDTSGAMLEVALEHRSGYPLSGVATTLEPQPELEHATRLVLEVDGQPSFERQYPPGGEQAIQAYEQWLLPTGQHHVRLLMFDRPGQLQPQVLDERRERLDPGQKIALSYHDVHLGANAQEGRRLYDETSLGTNAGCRICHSLTPGVVLVGPSFAGIATRAAQRIAGMPAEEYLRQSILEPDAYVVAGFPPGQMVPNLGELLTEGQIDDLVAFLMTLE